MNYTVRWEASALNELTTAWLTAPSTRRGQITTAAARVDTLLKQNPYGCSESREADLRVVIESPLTITFRVEEASQRVSVVHVWTSRSRS